MIRNDTEYREALSRLSAERQRLVVFRKRLRSEGLADDEIKRMTDPVESFHAQLKEEVASPERLKQKEIGELVNFNGLGPLLVSLRIAQGITQRELAKRLGVDESQITRDERNE